ncbi:hypothetical protein OIU41_11650 [Lacticaseibacillus paracasei]
MKLDTLKQFQDLNGHVKSECESIVDQLLNDSDTYEDAIKALDLFESPYGLDKALYEGIFEQMKKQATRP